MDSGALEALARRAVDGDRNAVAALVRGVQGLVYAVALRMLWHREDAEDATQEILVRIVTRLSQFDFRSKFTTWVYRVATNHLLDVKKSCVETKRLTFTSFAEDLEHGASDEGPADAERSILVEEVKIGCTLGMLQCLDRPHRLAYILGEIVELSAPEASEVLAIESATFRKRLQRAREAIEAFTRAQCGLTSGPGACRCNSRVGTATRTGRVDPDAIVFADRETSFAEARAALSRVHEAKRTLELYRVASPRPSAIDFAERVVAALEPAID